MWYQKNNMSIQLRLTAVFWLCTTMLHTQCAIVTPQSEKEFVIVIPSYNNKEWYKQNIDSALNQEYERFHVIYIDDASTDGTADLVEAYVRNHPQRDHFTLVRNKERIGALLNRYHVFHSLPSHVIICELDGDDWYAHTHVLQTLNRVYQDPNVWVTFGQFERVPQGSIGQSKPIPTAVLENNIYRFDGYYTSMLRTYYAWLYKQIRLQDLLCAGIPFHTCSDLAIMYPIIEMAHEHHRYIDEILYMVNRMNALNTENVTTAYERALQHRILKGYKKRYTSLPTDVHGSPKLPTTHKASASVILFSQENPLALKTLLQSIQHFIPQVNDIRVVYTAHAETELGYNVLRDTFCSIPFIRVPQTSSSEEFKALITKACDHAAPYILAAFDDCVVTKPIDCAQSIRLLAQTNAHGFYFGITKNKHRPYSERILLPPFITMRMGDDADSIYAWQFTGGKGPWMLPNNLDMTLYSKETFLHHVRSMTVSSFNDARYIWARTVDLDSIGLCYGVARTEHNPYAAPQKRDGNYHDELMLATMAMNPALSEESDRTSWSLPLLIGAAAGFAAATWLTCGK